MPRAARPITVPRRRTALILLVVGILPALWSGDFAADTRHFVQYAFIAAAVLASLIPGIHTRLFSLLERLRHPSPRTVGLVAFLLTVLAANYFIYTGMRQGRELIPKMHDEFMHLIQARLMSQGRLWLPQHPMADFFETFHVFVKPKYAPIYFPGTSLLYVPAMWLGTPPWVVSALVCGGIVGMGYVVFTNLIDGVAGALAAVVTLSLPTIHELSLMTTSHAPMLLATLLLIWAWLRWRRGRRLRWAAVLGALAGWAAIVRPLDALCVLIPLAVAMLLDLFRPKVSTDGITGTHARPTKRSITACMTGIVLLITAAPFLALQLTLDRGVTGHWLQSPASLYAKINWPAASLFFPPLDPHHRPPSHLPQFQHFYDTFVVRDTLEPIERDGVLKTWIGTRIPAMFRVALPSGLLLVFLPIGLTRLNTRQRRVTAAVLPMFLLAYGCFPPFLPYYTLVAAPALILLVLLGGQALEDTFPARRPMTGSLVFLSVIASSLGCISELNPGVRDPNVNAPVLTQIHEKLFDLPTTPALVLFHYDVGNDTNQEPVYNWETANPDDASVIRAQDLGPRNVELFEYYAHHGPPRMVYGYNRTNGEFKELGMAADLALHPPKVD